MLPDEEGINSILKPIIGPWYESIENPEQVPNDLVEKYRITDYGLSRDVSTVKSVSDYKKSFPIINYSGLIPYLTKTITCNWKKKYLDSFGA